MMHSDAAGKMLRGILLFALLTVASGGYINPSLGQNGPCGSSQCLRQFVSHGYCTGFCRPCTTTIRFSVIRLCRSRACLGHANVGPCGMCRFILRGSNSVPIGHGGYHGGLRRAHARLASSDLSSVHAGVRRIIGGHRFAGYHVVHRSFPHYNYRTIHGPGFAGSSARFYGHGPFVRRGYFHRQPVSSIGRHHWHSVGHVGSRVCRSSYCIGEYMRVGRCSGMCGPCDSFVRRYVFTMCQTRMCTRGYGSGLGLCHRCGQMFPGIYAHRHSALQRRSWFYRHHAYRRRYGYAVHPALAAAHRAGLRAAAMHHVHPRLAAAHAAALRAGHPLLHHIGHPFIHPAGHLAAHFGGHYSHVAHALIHAGVRKICHTSMCTREYRETGHCNGACIKCQTSFVHVCEARVCKTQYATEDHFSGPCAFCGGYFTNLALHGSLRHGSAFHHGLLRHHILPMHHAPPMHHVFLGHHAPPMHHAFLGHHALPMHLGGHHYHFQHGQSMHNVQGHGMHHGIPLHGMHGMHGPERNHGGSSHGKSEGIPSLRKKLDHDLYRIHMKKLAKYLHDKHAKMVHSVNKKKK